MNAKVKVARGKQSRRMSLIEALTNVGVGYGVAVLTQLVVFPLFGIHATSGEHLGIGFLFTITSVARSYALRRAFEAIRIRAATTNAARL